MSAQLLYDNLQCTGLTATTLGAALTSTGTTITFPSALQQYGVNIPTLANGNWIMLTLSPVGGSGSVSQPERVMLTAYTAGATTGTITRAQEGSTAVAHSSGEPFCCAASSNDLAPLANIDTPLSLGSGVLGFDYEFNASSSSLPSGWSWINQGTATYQENYGAGLLVGTTQSGENYRGVVESFAGAPSTWTLTAKMDFAIGNTQSSGGGLMLRESSSGKFYIFGMNYFLDVQLNHWASTTSVTGTDVTTNVAMTPSYFRVIKHSATSFDFLYSTQGTAWTTAIGAYNASYCVPDQIGFGVDANGTTYTPQLACNWLRVR